MKSQQESHWKEKGLIFKKCKKTVSEKISILEGIDMGSLVSSVFTNW